MEAQSYQIGIFTLITLFFLLYSVLDGFDLGIGLILPFSRDKAERESLVSYIAPFWDGNEVWLVIAVGFVFASFPAVLGMVLGAFYLPLMLLISGFILRAIALEYSYHDIKRRNLWHMTAAWGSYIVTVLGLFILGTAINGMPFEGPGMLSRDPTDYVTLFPVLFSVAGVFIVLWHGVTYALKHNTTSSRQTLAGRLWWMLAGTTALLMTVWLMTKPQILQNPLALAGAGISIAGTIGGRMLLLRKGWAFRLSCLSITGLWLLISASQFPFALRASHHPEWSLTIADAAAPVSTLQLLLKVGLILVPIILAYSYFTYKVLRIPAVKTEN